MKLRPEQRAILDLAVEDSFALSEVVSYVREQVPGLRNVRSVVKNAIVEMLEAGWLQLTHMAAPAKGEDDLDASSARRALDDDLAWVEARSQRPHLRIVATPQGKETYFADT